eukprot:6368075-Prymnesium_polylepis.1
MRGEPRPGGVRWCGQRASGAGGACQASVRRAQGRWDTVRRARALQTTLNGGDSHAACLLYSKDVNTP